MSSTDTSFRTQFLVEIMCQKKGLSEYLLQETSINIFLMSEEHLKAGQVKISFSDFQKSSQETKKDDYFHMH